MDQNKLIETLKRCLLLINKNCSYMNASLPESLHEYRYIENREINISMSKVLQIEITKDYYCYKRGRQYRLFYNDIYKTCDSIKKTDSAFAKRYDSGCLTEDDVQRIISKTSNNVLRVLFKRRNY